VRFSLKIDVEEGQNILVPGARGSNLDRLPKFFMDCQLSRCNLVFHNHEGGYIRPVRTMRSSLRFEHGTLRVTSIVVMTESLGVREARRVGFGGDKREECEEAWTREVDSVTRPACLDRPYD
jgi:hypothetical protein